MPQHIPNDILVEILACLPAKSLLRFTLVCKHWYSIITSPNFITPHLNRFGKTATDQLLIRMCNEKERYLLLSTDDTFDKDYVELEFPFYNLNHHSFHVVGSCNGLICLYDTNNFVGVPKNIIIWNPCIRKSVTLAAPQNLPNSCYVIIGFGFDLVKNMYKVVRIIHGKEDPWKRQTSPSEVEVYDQGEGEWRPIEHALPHYNSLWFYKRSQVFLHGAVHWVADKSKGYVNLIVAFEMGNEVFREMALPNGLSGKVTTLLTVSHFKDSLAVFSCEWRPMLSSPFVISECYVWRMTHYGVFESWTNLFSIIVPVVLNRPLGFRKNGEILFVSKESALVSYNPETKKIEKTRIKESVFSLTVMNFVESLVLLT